MGWTFRKSFSLLPGVRLNLSGKGVSASYGVKGARLLIGSGRKLRVTLGRGPFRYTKTLSGSSMHQPEPSRRAIVPAPPFALPLRGRYEANATVFQKRKLEQFAADRSGELPERFYELIDTLGREQAEYIIAFCERRAFEEELAQAEADRLAAEAFVAERQRVEAIDRGRARKQLLWAIPYAVGVVWTAYYLMQPKSAPVALSVTTATTAPKTATSARSAPTGNSPLRAQTFQERVARSQYTAVAKYPQLGIAGSAMNRAFLARYNVWKARADLRLTRPDWPEKLAEDCVASP